MHPLLSVLLHLLRFFMVMVVCYCLRQVAQACLQLTIQSRLALNSLASYFRLKCWDYRHLILHQAKVSFWPGQVPSPETTTSISQFFIYLLLQPLLSLVSHFELKTLLCSILHYPLITKPANENAQLLHHVCSLLSILIFPSTPWNCINTVSNLYRMWSPTLFSFLPPPPPRPVLFGTGSLVAQVAQVTLASDALTGLPAVISLNAVLTLCSQCSWTFLSSFLT